MGNTFKTAFFLTALTLLLMFLGRIFGGQNGMVIALVFAALLNFVSYFFSDKLALAMYRAQRVTREELPRAYEIVGRLTSRAGLPMPKIYVIPTDSPNAFATDTRRIKACRTSGERDIKRTLSPNSLTIRFGYASGFLAASNNVSSL